MKEIKLKETNEAIEILEREFRIEKKSVDYWYNISRGLIRDLHTQLSCAYVLVMETASEMTERDLIRIYTKGSIDKQDKSITTEHKFIKFYSDRMALYSAANAQNIDLVINYKKAKKVEYYRELLVIKFTITSRTKEGKKVARYIHLWSRDEDEQKKLLIVCYNYAADSNPQQCSMATVKELISGERSLEMFSLPKQVLDFEVLERFVHNSEFVIRQEDDDKIKIFTKIHQERKNLEKEFE